MSPISFATSAQCLTPLCPDTGSCFIVLAGLILSLRLTLSFLLQPSMDWDVRMCCPFNTCFQRTLWGSQVNLCSSFKQTYWNFLLLNPVYYLCFGNKFPCCKHWWIHMSLALSRIFLLPAWVRIVDTTQVYIPGCFPALNYKGQCGVWAGQEGMCCTEP